MPDATQLRPRFEVDSEDSPSSVLVDPEQYDATEEQFSASLARPAPPPVRFVPDQPAAEEQTQKSISAAPPVCAEPNVSLKPELSRAANPSYGTLGPQEHSDEKVNLVSRYRSSDTADSMKSTAPPADFTRSGSLTNCEAGAALIAAGIDKTVCSEPSRDPAPVRKDSSFSPDAWKEELAARLSSYRAKRKPRPPKYPSLSLNFEPPYPVTSGSRARTPDSRSSLAEQREPKISSDAPAQKVLVVPAEDLTPPSTIASSSGRLIEFPRFFAPEEPSPDQLAEPVCEQPRILDAPDIEMPAPALGGIILESNEEPATEERPGFEVPLRSASISRRLLAAAVDGAVIISAETLFAYIFLQLVKVLPPHTHLLAPATLVGGILWAGYQYLLLTYSGTTPGLRLAKLQLTYFDGSAVLRSRRRWRVVASLLSAVSLGLGFAWCFLDEDALCWHDRITRTYLAPRD